MDWIRKNPFLAGLLGVVLVAVGVLGYLLYSQLGTYDQTSQDYDTAVKERDRLQNTKPFPFQKSKTELINLRKETTTRVTDLQKRLADYEPPAERADFKPVEFQDKLRQVVEQITQLAKGSNVELPAEFYMGFEQYRGTPPDATAAPALSRELDAVEDLLKILINRHIEKLTSIRRAPLPQEPAGMALNPQGAQPAGPPRPGTAPSSLASSVARYPVDVAFSCQPSAFRDTLDDLVTSKRLFVVRALQVKNQSPKSPPRDSLTPGGQAAPPPAAPAAPVDPGAPLPPPAEKPPITYIVGLEKLDVDMRIEIVKVAPPAAVATR